MLYQILPEAYTDGLFVVIIVSFAKLYDNALGSNNAILFNSDYYKMVLIFGVLLAILAVVFNLIFIPLYGVNGAALATFIAIVIYNTLKLLFVKHKLKMQPFTIHTLKMLMVLALLSFGFYYVDFNFHPIMNIALKSMGVSVIYVALIYSLNISEDINIQLRKYVPFLK